MYSSPGNSNTKTGEDKDTCKQRFKGIETFLRRIAFNLGNSPSQTEVKIISCIPIDVTDLQNKIISLERQLIEATNCKASTKHAPVHAALIDPTIRNTNTVLSCKCSEVKPLGLEDTNIMPLQCVDGSSKTRKSVVSFLYPTLSATGLQRNQPFMSTENWIEKESIDTSVEGHHKRFFRRYKKKKSSKKKENRKTQLVYYAQTENSPFTSYGLSSDIPFLGYPKPKVDNAFSQSYLADIFQRHFDPERVVEEFSDTSHFTSPVCRDFHTRSRCPYESDVCSCCHGQFQNVDKYMSKNQNFIIEPVATRLHSEFNKGIYYDSNLYDIVPVKEKAAKVTKEEKLPMKEPKHSVDMRCWPESTRTKQRHQTKLHTKLKNYEKPTYRFQDAKDSIKIKTPNHSRDNKVDKRTGPTDTSNSICIDCSEIYPKPFFRGYKSEKRETEPVRTVFRKNAECLTIDVDPKNLTITKSIQIDINSTETKTEETLNQIKSILQSVLEEVKTNPQVNHLLEANSKKDADVQKGPSQSNMQTCSSLLHSFTYNNSCNTNPYLLSCSRQSPSPFCFTNVPYPRPNCTQNFPLLIQTPGYQKCGCFYKTSSHKSAPAQKQAANMSTNTETDNRESQSCETEKLIKEIYKSIALTVDLQKETSNSEYDELKSVSNNYTDASELKDLRKTIVAMSETSRRDAKIGASMTPLSTTTVRSKYSLIGSKPDGNRNEVDCYKDYDSQSTEHEILDTEGRHRSKQNVASTISEHYSEELTTDDESDGIIETVEDTKDKIKKSLLTRMLKSVNIFNKKKQKEPERKGEQKQRLDRKVDEEKFESDSDDYQTIYSEKINRREQHVNGNYKSRNYASYRPAQERTAQRIRNSRRSPYMEQEYRRQWNEQLMFQKNRGRRYSSERPYSFQQSPVYWQNYEARSAIVDHQVPYRAAYSPVQNIPIKTVIHKVEQRTSPLNIMDTKGGKPKFSWLKKHKLGISQCGEQWKKFILEN